MHANQDKKLTTSQLETALIGLLLGASMFDEAARLGVAVVTLVKALRNYSPTIAPTLILEDLLQITEKMKSAAAKSKPAPAPKVRRYAIIYP